LGLSDIPAQLKRKYQTVSASFHNDWQTLRLARSVARRAPSGEKRPVIFFNASTRIRGHSQNAAFSLLASWALRLSGTPVVHFVCSRGMSHCLQGTDQDNVRRSMPCAACIYQSRVNYGGAAAHFFHYYPDLEMASALAKLDLPGLMEYTHPFEDADLPLGRLVLPSMRWRLRCLTLPDEEPTRYLFRQFILSAWNVLVEFHYLLNTVKNPQAVVIFNGQTFPEAIVRWLAERRGIRAITHEVSMYPLSAFFTSGEATALPMTIPDDFDLDAEQNARLDELMQNRFKGQVSMAGISFFPEMKGLDESFLQKAAGFKQIVPVFTNVIFDTTQEHSNAFFSNMFGWLDAVLEVMRHHPETLFVLRAHPDEARPGKTSRESVAMWVERSRGAELPNLIFVPPAEYISSYELIRRSRFVMIYNSTIGLEASIMGKPVLSAGSSRFSRHNTMYFPIDRVGYLQQLESFLSSEVVEALPEHIRNARRFLYFQYFYGSLPFGDFIEPSVPRGYVKMKPFDLGLLYPGASRTVHSLLEGILKDREFTLRE
jgi:hypothetical protein